MTKRTFKIKNKGKHNKKGRLETKFIAKDKQIDSSEIWFRWICPNCNTEINHTTTLASHITDCYTPAKMARELANRIFQENKLEKKP